MTIIAPLPFTLTNGSEADASQVMANLNQIRNDVNTNAQPAGGSVVAAYSGAVVSFAASDVAVPVFDDFGATTLTFDTSIMDTDGFFSMSNPSRLTVPAGVSLIRLSARVSLTLLTTAPQVLMFASSGTPIPEAGSAYGTQQSFNAIPVAIHVISDPIAVTPGDYFTVLMENHSNAGSGEITTLLQAYSHFEMQVLT